MKKTLSIFAAVMLFGLLTSQLRAYTYTYWQETSPYGNVIHYVQIDHEDVYVDYVEPSNNGHLIIPSTTNGGDTITGILSAGGSWMTSIFIPNTITIIGAGAFSNCTGLTSITIPSSVTSIGDGILRGCTGLTSVVVASGNSFYDSRNNCNAIIETATNTLVSGCYSTVIPNTVTAIGNYAFSGYPNLTSVSLTSVITSIGEGAFLDCSGLTSITIPNSVDSIGAAAFKNCSGLTSVNFNADSCVYAGYTENNSLHTPFGSTCTALTTVNVGNNVKALPDYIFSYCRNLTNINLPNSLKYIGKYALSNTAIGGNLTIPDSVTVINEDAFWRCYNLTGVTLSNSLTEIGRAAFCEDTNLVSSVTIPNFVTTIGGGAFRNCKGLTSVILGSSVSSIGDDAFWNCKGLTSVIFGSSVSSIGEFAFGRCTGLTSLTIPASVTTIKGGAFYYCTGLTEIHSLNRVAPQLDTYTENDQTYGAFDGVTSTIPVYIPCGSSASYYSRWSYFSNFVEDEGFTFTATSANDQQGTVQILTMPTCTSPQAVVYASANSGYHFDHWSDNSTANPYSLTVTDDLNLVAYFAADGGGTDGIDDIDAAGIRIYSEAGRIVVEGTTDEVNIYDMTGRSVRNDNLPAGVYMVKVGNLPARKVVVMR